MVAETLLSLREVVVRYGTRAALRLSRLDIEAGEVLAIIGPNGSGKSTLLRVAGLLQPPTDGTVWLGGENVRKADTLALRRRIATLFQEPLLLNATVYENAALGLKLRGVGRAEITRRLEPWLERFGIAHLAGRSARTLSGGEAQRTSLARAFVLDPELLLLDEPFAALDAATREALLSELRAVIESSKITTVLVTHDRQEAFTLGKRVGVLKEGNLLQIGPRDEVFFRPRTSAVAEIVGVENCLAGVVEAAGDDFSTVRLGPDQMILRVAGRFEAEAKVTLCIRPEALLLKGGACAASGYNRWTGRVAAITPGINQHRVIFDCGGFSLIALGEREHLSDSAYAAGQACSVLISPFAVHVIEARTSSMRD